MILSDTEILKASERGDILIEPFDLGQLGGNSYDVRLGPVLRVYKTGQVVTAAMTSSWWDGEIQARRWHHQIGQELKDWCDLWQLGPWQLNELDAAIEPELLDINIPPDGIVLVPGILYLASTVEYTETRQYVPYLDGKSSVGRLGISVHETAGRGDAGNKDALGFCGHWTMEIDVVQSVRVYAGMPIGQLTWHLVHGEVERAYASKPGASYRDGRDPLPQPSRLWRKMQGSR